MVVEQSKQRSIQFEFHIFSQRKFIFIHGAKLVKSSLHGGNTAIRYFTSLAVNLIFELSLNSSSLRRNL